ncbi:MAG: hypothetical protein CM15mP115_15730 [Alphaproteobacteria bacterium]|nr:MAG: hypothetical protein CM15mP115_15730 [Alphaproteobacteria bacterium]
MPRAGILQCQLAAGDRGGNGECAGLDPVGDDVVCRIAEAVDTLDRNCIRAVAGDARAHCDQAFGKIADLGSRAAFTISDVPLASVAAIIAFSVAPTDTIGKTTRAPVSPPGALA